MQFFKNGVFLPGATIGETWRGVTGPSETLARKTYNFCLARIVSARTKYPFSCPGLAKRKKLPW